jgi:hypothetical protein
LDAARGVPDISACSGEANKEIGVAEMQAIEFTYQSANLPILAFHISHQIGQLEYQHHRHFGLL